MSDPKPFDPFDPFDAGLCEIAVRAALLLHQHLRAGPCSRSVPAENAGWSVRQRVDRRTSVGRWIGQNWWASVDSARANVAACPPLITLLTSSK